MGKVNMAKVKAKKKKQGDFQKVKLKVGKKLPKGQNVTDTSFKSQSIRIREQLKSNTDQPTTKKKLSLTDLLSHCQHYNSNMRQEGLVGLKELLSSNPHVLKSNLGSILERMSELFLDKDETVRGSVHKVLSHIFSLTPSMEFSPFFPVMTAYLRCAMTHILDEIQLDSLGFLDLFLNFYPSLVTNSSQLLENFMEQISRKLSGGGGQSAGTATDRSLLVNPASKLSSQKWRLTVFGRLKKFLKAKLDGDEGEVQDSHQKGCGHVVRMQDIRIEGSCVLPLGASAVEKNYQTPSLVLRAKETDTAASGESQDILERKEKLQNFVRTLVPLLLQCWVEVGTAQMSTNLPENSLSGESLSMLDCVLGVLQLLIRLVVSNEDVDGNQMKWMRDQYAKDVALYIMAHFPYSTPDRMAKTKGKGPKVEQPQVSSTSLNLAVCEVMVGFLPPMTDGSKSPAWLKKVTNYLQTRVSGGRLSVEHTETVIRVLGQLFISGINQDLLHELLETMAKVVKSRPTTTPDGRLMLKFFSSLVTDSQFSQCNFERMNTVCDMLQCFPQKLAGADGEDEVSLSFLLATTAAQASRKQPSVLEALQNNLLGILALLPRVRSPLQQRIAELLFWTPGIDLTIWKYLCTICLQKDSISTATVRYILQMLSARLRYLTDGETEYVSRYLSFLLTLSAGHSAESLHQLSESSSEQGERVGVVLLEDSYDQWTSQQEQTSFAVKEIGLFSNQDQVLEIVLDVTFNLLKSLKVIPLITGISLLRLLCILNTTNSNFIGGDFLRLLGILSIRMISCTSKCNCDAELANHVQTYVLATLELTIKTLPSILAEIIELTISDLKEAEDPAQTESVIVMLSKMMQSTSVKHVMSNQSSEMQALLYAAKEKFGQRLHSPSWAEYSYGLSLLNCT